MPIIQPDDVLTTAEVCRLLKITRPTLYHWIEEGKLTPWKKLGDGSTFLFLRNLLTGKPIKRYSRNKETAGGATARVFLLSQDPALVKQARSALQSQGYYVSIAENFPGIETILKEEEAPEIIILDLAVLPHTVPVTAPAQVLDFTPPPALKPEFTSGWKLFAEIKKLVSKANHPPPAYILLSGDRATPLDAAKALKNGAWDFLKKPIASSVFLARVRLSLRRRFWTELDAAPGKCVFTSQDGSIGLDANHRILKITDPMKHTAAVPLTRKESELLCLFLKRPGMIFSKSTLLELIWGYTVNIRTRTIDCHIKNLRHKLSPYGRRIETCYNFGYRFH